MKTAEQHLIKSYNIFLREHTVKTLAFAVAMGFVLSRLLSCR